MPQVLASGLRKNNLAPSSTSACAIIGSRPAQASTSPRISAVLPSACCSSTGVMSFSDRPASSSARTRKMCGSVPRVTATRLPLRSATVAILESLAVTIAVDPGDQRRGTRGRAEIDRTGIEKFERLVGTGRLHPDDADAVLGEFLLEQSLLLEDHRHRIICRPIDMNFLERVGGAGATGHQRRDGNDRGYSAP